MAKFITISLLAYAAAFLFFTPVRAGRHNQDDICIQDMMAAAENPDRGIHPLSPIRDRMKDIFITTSTSPAIQCSMGEVLATPENIPKKRFAILRSFHHSVFDKLKRLFERLTKVINNKDYNVVRQILPEAQALVFSGILWHCRQEGVFRSLRGFRAGRSTQKELTLPAYDCALFEEYVDEKAYVESLRRLAGLPATPSSSPAWPVNSGTRHDEPDSGYDATAADTYVSETQGALPDPSSLDCWFDHIRNQNDDGPDYGYALPHGSAPMLGSTNPGIQLSEGYTDPEYLQYENEFGLPAYEQVGPSSSGTLNVPYDYGYAYDSAPMFGQSAVSETPGALPAPPSSSPALPVYSGTLNDPYDYGYAYDSAPTFGQSAVSETPGALPAPPSSSPPLPVYSGTFDDALDFGYTLLLNSAQLSGTASPGTQPSDSYMAPAYRHHGIEFGGAAHDQVGPSGGSTSYSDSHNKQRNARRNIDD
ncbi:hypothetical protein SeLEV6574_g01773 [Synchytrium endobioticum]|uniref:Uncharacterized protein n=1 Tax=Synchytrium endobioticum TaxID=286115 RepID=A0A507DDI4_9FUNG|nr:hypothetical protein SeLEV6574_g01773 [Synchytrium endobioticum]